MRGNVCSVQLRGTTVESDDAQKKDVAQSEQSMESRKVHSEFEQCSV